MQGHRAARVTIGPAMVRCVVSELADERTGARTWLCRMQGSLPDKGVIATRLGPHAASEVTVESPCVRIMQDLEALRGADNNSVKKRNN